MRFVDIEQVELPEGWQARADKALSDLRQEVAAAAAAADALPVDIANARKAAIREGLDVAARAQIWRDLAVKLGALTKGKCWYSESRNPTADKNVDHFRPKGRVLEDPSHEGYWWLAFSWRNYRFASQWCNQRRVDDRNDTSGGKADHFPIIAGGFRARQEADDIDLEDFDLLDPVDPDDWKLLTFRSDGRPTPAKSSGTREHERAAMSISVYHLHCRELVVERRAVAGTVQRIIQDLETLRPQLKDLKMRALYKAREKDLLRAIHPLSEYSAAALAYARAEILVERGGQQVRRAWLEDILHSE